MRQDRNKGRSYGFTLMEMLIIIAIIALLLALLMPTLEGARASARQAVCASNLHQLGEALQMVRVDQSGGRASFAVDAWVAASLPYVDGEEDAYVCPDDEDPRAGLGSLIRIGVFNVQNLFVRELVTDEALYVVKLNEQQYLANPPQQGVFYDPPPHEPGADPSVYYYCVEDKGEQLGDSDFDDVQVRVQANEDGSFDLEVKEGGTAYRNKIIEAGSKRVLISLSSSWQSVHVDGVRTSYGINNLTPTRITGPRKLLLVDYEQPVASPEDDWEYWRQASGAYEFGRHHGHANVLFADLAVQTVPLLEFDPRLSSNVATYWER